MGVLSDFVLADGNEVFGTADHTGGCAANLDMGNRANRLQLEHEVERRHFQRADIGHAQHLGDMLNRRAGQPAFLLLGTP